MPITSFVERYFHKGIRGEGAAPNKSGPFKTRRKEKRKTEKVHTLREALSLPERFVSHRTP